MDKFSKFVMIVQTQAIVDGIIRARDIAGQVVGDALAIPEESIPDDYYRAALQFVAYEYGDRDRPEWLGKRDA